MFNKKNKINGIYFHKNFEKLIEKNKITFEQALSTMAIDFLCFYIKYIDDAIYIDNKIKEHNLEIEKIDYNEEIEYIEDCLNNRNDRREDSLLLHAYNCREDLLYKYYIRWLNKDKNMNIMAADGIINNKLNNVNKYYKQSYSQEDFLNFCVSNEEVIAFVSDINNPLNPLHALPKFVNNKTKLEEAKKYTGIVFLKIFTTFTNKEHERLLYVRNLYDQGVIDKATCAEKMINEVRDGIYIDNDFNYIIDGKPVDMPFGCAFKKIKYIDWEEKYLNIIYEYADKFSKSLYYREGLEDVY